MKIIFIILSSLGVLLSNTVYAQTQANGAKIVLPPGVKIYENSSFDGGSYINLNQEDIAETDVIRGRTVDGVPSNMENINQLNYSNLAIPVIPNQIVPQDNANTVEQLPLQIPQANINQNRMPINQNFNNQEVKKSVGQVPIKTVIIPLENISSFNKTTIKEMERVGIENLENSYMEFLYK